jgi:ABC-type branched-subunit amino acid transport system substrate-binding protein
MSSAAHRCCARLMTPASMAGPIAVRSTQFGGGICSMLRALRSRASWRLAVLSTILVLAVWRTAGATTAVQLVYVGTVESTVWRGIEQGWREANILGGYTGHTYHVQTMDPVALLTAQGQQPPATASAEGASLTAPFPMAVLAATDAETLQRLSTKFATAGVAVLNLTADDEALRQACLSNVLHIAPSARMKADAIAQWQKKKPAAPVQARAWHEDFTKFAAGELNNRFRKAHGIPMDDDAWAGWAALKMLSEAVARAQTTEPARILAYLRNELAFDGQKGVPQTFRDTGQLRQPILLVENGKLVGEAPVPGVVDSNDLDSLGRTSCKQ